MDDARVDETIANAAKTLLSLRNGDTRSTCTIGARTIIATRCYSDEKLKKGASLRLPLALNNTPKPDFDDHFASPPTLLQQPAQAAHTAYSSRRTLPSLNKVLSRRQNNSDSSVLPPLRLSETGTPTKPRLLTVQPHPENKMSDQFSFFYDGNDPFQDQGFDACNRDNSLEELFPKLGPFPDTAAQDDISNSFSFDSAPSSSPAQNDPVLTASVPLQTSSVAAQDDTVFATFLQQTSSVSTASERSSQNVSANATEIRAALTESTSQTPPTTPANGLHFASLAEAQAHASSRVPLNIENDDWAAMEAKPTPYIKHIMAVFTSPLAPAHPADPTASPAEWSKWQLNALARSSKIRRSDPLRTELASWLLFGAVIDAHKRGVKSRTPTTLKCSAHLESILQPLRDLAIFRVDLLRLERIDELVSNVQGAVTRKLSNYKGNGRKTNRDVENAKRAAAGGVEYDSVLGQKGGRKRKSEDGDEGAAAPAKKKGKKSEAAAASERVSVLPELGVGLGGYPTDTTIAGALDPAFWALAAGVGGGDGIPSIDGYTLSSE